MLFFLFACIGNLTYVLSILAYEPTCFGAEVGKSQDGICGKGEWGQAYARYIGVNASWLVGSAGTLVLDMGIFCQFFYYRDGRRLLDSKKAVGNGHANGSGNGRAVRDSEDQGERPLLG